MAPVGAAASSIRVTPWKPRTACSAGISPLLQAGSASAPATPTSASLMPSGSVKPSTGSPKRSVRASHATPFSTNRCAQ